MQTTNVRSDLIRNISIIEFLFIVVLLVLANFSRQLEETNKKASEIIVLMEERNKLKDENKKLRSKIKDLNDQLDYYKKLSRDKLDVTEENIAKKTS